MTTSVSVIVPAGGADRAVECQLRALRRQQLDRPFEVVVAANTRQRADRTRLREMVRRHGTEGWRVVDAVDGQGPSYARNVGVAHAGGDLLAFADADDIVADTWLGALVAGLDDADAVTGTLRPFGASERDLAARPPLTDGGLPTYMGVPYLLTSNLGVRRAAYDAVGGFDEELRTCEDMAFAWSLVVSGFVIGWAPDAEVHYRYRPGLRAMARQHFAYGRGISQVLLRYGIPEQGRWTRPGRRLLQSNGLPGAKPSLANRVRRAAMASGRIAGILETAGRVGSSRA